MNVWDVVLIKVILDFLEIKVIVIVGYFIVFMYGYVDGGMLFEFVLVGVEIIVKVIELLVIVDLDDGYVDLGEMIWCVIVIGVVGVNVEDCLKFFDELVVWVCVIVVVVEVEGVFF